MIQTVNPMLMQLKYEDIKSQMVLQREIQNDQAYGLKFIQYLQNKGSGQIMNYKGVLLFCTTKTTDTSDLYERSKQDVLLRQGLKEASIVKLIKYNTSQYDALCGSVYKIHMIYEYTQDSLYVQLKKRQSQKKHFTEEELYFLLKCLLSALMGFQKLNLRHGSIQPKNIMIKQLEGIELTQLYQLTDLRFLTDMYEYRRQLLGFADGCYLSPQLLQELGRRTYNPIYNYEKSEVFSIGLVLVEAGLLKSVRGIYDFESFKVSQETLEVYLSELRERYTTKFVELVTWMLQINELQRCSFIDLEKEIQQKSGLHQSVVKSVIKDQLKSPIIEEFSQVIPLTTQVTRSVSPKPQRYLYSQEQLPRSTNRFDVERFLEDDSIYRHSASRLSPGKSKVEPQIYNFNSSINDRMRQFDEELKDLRNQFHSMYRPEQSRYNPLVTMSQDPKVENKRVVYLVDEKRKQYDDPQRQPIGKRYSEQTYKEPSFKVPRDDPIDDRWKPSRDKKDNEINLFGNNHENKKKGRKLWNEDEQNPYVPQSKNNYNEHDDYGKSYIPKETMSFMPNEQKTKNQIPTSVDCIKILSPRQHSDPQFVEAFRRLDYKLGDPKFSENLNNIRSLSDRSFSPIEERYHAKIVNSPTPLIQYDSYAWSQSQILE